MRIERVKKIRVAKTTEDRLWDFIAEQTEILHELATNEKIDVARKRLIADTPYYKIKAALKQLGVLL